ncbi:MAG: tyrosine protein phosphatase [Clostridia bacterium]|nr:tyrosine protein phosphatase [Clostridia bacterium]
MIDIHSHIIFGIDDGAVTLEHSCNMLREAHNSGVTAIIATPHYKQDMYEAGLVQKNWEELQGYADCFKIKLLAGCEMRMNAFLPEMVSGKKELALNKTRFILIELPPDKIPSCSEDVFYRLRQNQFTPVIAHPERNRTLAGNFSLYKKWVEAGYLMQVDSASILGHNGWKVKAFTKKIIKMKLIHFIASDAHDAYDYREYTGRAYERVVGWAGQEFAHSVYFKNAEDLLMKC